MALSDRVPLRAVLILAAGASLGAVASRADAAIVFSNVSITGSLAGGATFATGPNDIDFTFVSAKVGDGEPTRSGNIVITYLARSDNQDSMNGMLLSLLGGLSGSGTVIFNEVIEDQAVPGVIGSYGVTLGPATPPPALPHVKTIGFTRASTFVKVKKTLLLVAPDSGTPLDFAQIGLVEQRLLPTPGTAALLGVAGLLMLKRRRHG